MAVVVLPEPDGPVRQTKGFFGCAESTAAAAALICTALTGSPRGIETALILGCGTLQMLVLYIFGLYFAHAYKEIKARPVYIVRERG